MFLNIFTWNVISKNKQNIFRLLLLFLLEIDKFLKKILSFYKREIHFVI